MLYYIMLCNIYNMLYNICYIKINLYLLYLEQSLVIIINSPIFSKLFYF